MNIKNVAIKVLAVSALFYGTNLHSAATPPVFRKLNSIGHLTLIEPHLEEFSPSIAFSHDGTRIFSTTVRQSTSDIPVRSWFLRKTNPLIQTMVIQDTSILQETFSKYRSIIQNTAISPDGNHVAAVFDGGKQIAIWNTLLKTLWFYISDLNVNSVTFSPDSKQIIVCHESVRSKSKRNYKTNITVINSDMENPEYAKPVGRLDATVHTFDYPLPSVSAAVMCPNGLLVCANATQARTNIPIPDDIRIFNPATNEWICIIRTNQTIKSIAITSNGKRIITGGYRQQPGKTLDKSEMLISFWDVESKTCLCEFHHNDIPCHIAISPDDTQIAVSFEFGVIIVCTDVLAKSNKDIVPWTTSLS